MCALLLLSLLLQVNHLGPYTLTRMLEPKLIASKARIVNVVSVTHRLDKIRSAGGCGAWQHTHHAAGHTCSCTRRRPQK